MSRLSERLARAKAGLNAPPTGPAVPVVPVDGNGNGNGQIIDIESISRFSRSSRPKTQGYGPEPEKTDPDSSSPEMSAGVARGDYQKSREIREIRELAENSVAYSSRSLFLKREIEGENGKSDPLRAVSEPSDPAERLAEWRAGLARLHPDYAPCAGYRHGEWARVLACALAFLDDHGEWAAKLGWTTADLFGVHPEAGAVRVDACGALALGPNPVRWLTMSAITYENGNTFRRKPGQPIGVPWWNLDLPPL